MENEITGKLRDYIKGIPWVKLAFLFGSRATGRVMAESDYDIGVWPDETASEGDYNRLWAELERLLKSNVDLVDMSRGRPTIVWEAFKGIPLFIRDERFYIDKRLEVSSEAEDIGAFIIDIWNSREAKIQ